MAMPSLDGRPWSGASFPSFLERIDEPNISRERYKSREKLVGDIDVVDYEQQRASSSSQDGSDSGELRRSLKSRHITMIAIGGTVGTGLIIGTGQALAKAGPGSIFIAYTLVGFLVYLVMSALGEMAAWIPLPSGFTGYASRFCDPALGFALGYTYYFKYLVDTPNNMTAVALVMQYWISPEKVNPGVWVVLLLVVAVAVNYFGVKIFGELQFWLSSTKVLVFLGLMMLSIVLAAGGGPDHHATGFKYWKDPGAFRPYVDMEHEAFGKFLGIWSALINAVFAYLGTELVGVTIGEAENPRKTIPSAIKMSSWRIAFFYVGSVFLVGLLVPYDSKALAFATKASTSASASPFVVAIELAGIKVLPGFINGCIVLFIASGTISDLYIATRTIYGLAIERSAPAILAKTNKSGTPVYALALSSVSCLLAFMTVSRDSREVFAYFVDMVTVFGLLTWISILITHIRFVLGRRTQNIPDEWMPYKAPFGIWGSYGALIFCVIMTLTKHFHVFVCHNDTHGKRQCFDWRHFLTGYLGIFIYLSLIFGHKMFVGAKRVGSLDMDFYTGKDIVDQEEIEWIARENEKRERDKTRHWLYQRFVSWLF